MPKVSNSGKICTLYQIFVDAMMYDRFLCIFIEPKKNLKTVKKVEEEYSRLSSLLDLSPTQVSLDLVLN